MVAQLLTYALVKALYDRKRDYIDTFTPFVLGVLDIDRALEVQDVARAVDNRWSLFMPFHVTERILSKATKTGLVEQLHIHKSADGYRLTSKGERVCCSMEDEERVSRRVAALVKAICEYARNEHGETYTAERTRQSLLALIQENLEEFARYVNPRMIDDGSPVVGGDGIILLKYIEHAKTSVPDHYKTICDLVFGSVITAVLDTPDASALNEIERPLAGTVAYLDSNVIFSLLGMQSEHLNAAAQELVGLMKAEGMFLRTFSFVLDETRNVLLRYAKRNGVLPGGHNPESVYIQLRIRGISKSDALELASNLAQNLRYAGVQVESTPAFDLGTYKPTNQEIYDLLIRTKAANRPDTNIAMIEGAARVDMAAIEMITVKRGGRIAKLEEARYLFITRDKRLATFNRSDMGHETSGTIPEVLLDGVLTNMLWLKNPQLAVSLESIIAVHSDDLLRYDALWVRFTEIVTKLRAENRMDAADASALLTEESIVSIMEEAPNLRLADVDDEMVLSEAKRFRKQIDARVKALEKSAKVAQQLAAEREQEKSQILAVSNGEKNALSGKLESRDASIRMLVRREARVKARNHALVRVVPVVLTVWGLSFWVTTALPLQQPWKLFIRAVLFILSSGFAWWILQFLIDQARDEIEFDLLQKHGLTSAPGQE